MSLKDRYEAAMVLSGVGDALGYRNGKWEFCKSGISIHEELEKLGGIENIKVEKQNWRVSDDTVLHLATAEAVIEHRATKDKKKLYSLLAKGYQKCMADMQGRSPGDTCMIACTQLEPEKDNGYRIPFNPQGGGCGAAIRAMCIGLRFPQPNDIEELVAVSIEAGRMTHNHPTGYLGSLASALFTSYAIQDKPVKEWGAGLLATLIMAKDYVMDTGQNVKENKEEWEYFDKQWLKYIEQRKIQDGNSDPQFPEFYDVNERDIFYRDLSFNGTGGASGHDAPMIAYDALLGSGNNWEELCNRGMFHGGDSDSTGVIAGCLFGAMYGFQGVPDCNFKMLEYRDRLKKAARELFFLTSASSCDEIGEDRVGSR